MSTAFSSELGASSSPFVHSWEHCIGSGHATLALCADWLPDRARCHAELGFRNVCCHGLLSDEVGTLTDQNNQLLYSFQNAGHANAKTAWQAMDSPHYPTPAQVAMLNEASQMVWQPLDVRTKCADAAIDVTLQPQSVTVVELI